MVDIERYSLSRWFSIRHLGGNPTLENGAEMKCKIVIYGAGMAGAILASRLAEDLDVTVVAPTDYFEVPMAMPRLMVQPGFADKAIVPITEALPKAQHIRGRLVELIGAGGLVDRQLVTADIT